MAKICLQLLVFLVIGTVYSIQRLASIAVFAETNADNSKIGCLVGCSGFTLFIEYWVNQFLVPS